MAFSIGPSPIILQEQAAQRRLARRAENLKAFNEYVAAKRAAGEEVSYEELANMAEQLSDGDNWMRRQFPAESVLRQMVARTEDLAKQARRREYMDEVARQQEERNFFANAISPLLLDNEDDATVLAKFSEQYPELAADMTSRFGALVPELRQRAVAARVQELANDPRLATVTDPGQIAALFPNAPRQVLAALETQVRGRLIQEHQARSQQAFATALTLVQQAHIPELRKELIETIEDQFMVKFTPEQIQTLDRVGAITSNAARYDAFTATHTKTAADFLEGQAELGANIIANELQRLDLDPNKREHKPIFGIVAQITERFYVPPSKARAVAEQVYELARDTDLAGEDIVQHVVTMNGLSTTVAARTAMVDELNEMRGMKYAPDTDLSRAIDDTIKNMFTQVEMISRAAQLPATDPAKLQAQIEQVKNEFRRAVETAARDSEQYNQFFRAGTVDGQVERLAAAVEALIRQLDAIKVTPQTMPALKPKTPPVPAPRPPAGSLFPGGLDARSNILEE